MIRMRGRGRLPTMAPSRMPPPHANAIEIATSYSVTASAWPYSPASFQPAASVEESDGRNSSGISPVRGRISHSAIRPMTINLRSVAALISASRRFADMPPDAVAQGAEGVTAQHLIGARARQRDLQLIDDATGPRRHHDHLIGEIDRFRQAVGDEHDGLAGGRPDPQQLVAHGHAGLLVKRRE